MATASARFRLSSSLTAWRDHGARTLMTASTAAPMASPARHASACRSPAFMPGRSQPSSLHVRPGSFRFTVRPVRPVRPSRPLPRGFACLRISPISGNTQIATITSSRRTGRINTSLLFPSFVNKPTVSHKSIAAFSQFEGVSATDWNFDDDIEAAIDGRLSPELASHVPARRAYPVAVCLGADSAPCPVRAPTAR